GSAGRRGLRPGVGADRQVGALHSLAEALAAVARLDARGAAAAAEAIVAATAKATDLETLRYLAEGLAAVAAPGRQGGGEARGRGGRGHHRCHDQDQGLVSPARLGGGSGGGGREAPKGRAGDRPWTLAKDGWPQPVSGPEVEADLAL